MTAHKPQRHACSEPASGCKSHPTSRQGAQRQADKTHAMDRRTFVRSAIVGALGVSMLNAADEEGATNAAVEEAKGKLPLGIPGPFPGEVVEVHHPGSIVQRKVQESAVREMVQRGLMELTGAPDATAAWKFFFEPGDVVGVKVNPVGRPKAISSFPLVHAVADGLKSAGVGAKDIIVFDRYRKEFREARYHKNLPDGVREDAATEQYDGVQLDLGGYDPEVYREIELIDVQQHDPNDDRARRSHVAMIVSRKVNKIINLPVLKDHGSAGVTLALKNMSHGFVNNVARSHASATTNACNTFIPAIVALPVIRRKVVLHILDGTTAVFEGGPFQSPGNLWYNRTLHFATDPVAMDRYTWDIIDKKRIEKGLPPVAQSHFSVPQTDEAKRFHSYRQPQHIELASALGLGVYDRDKIKSTRLDLGA